MIDASDARKLTQDSINALFPDLEEAIKARALQGLDYLNYTVRTQAQLDQIEALVERWGYTVLSNKHTYNVRIMW